MTPREAIFYGEYIKDGNGTRAALAAGYPEKSAHVAATRLLKKGEIARAIDAWKASQCSKLEITAERVLQELAKLATFDPGRLYDADGYRIPVHKLDDHTRAAVAAVEDETEDGPGRVRTMKQKIRFADKGQNLERLGKYLKLFGDAGFGANVEIPGGLPEDSTIKIVLVRPE